MLQSFRALILVSTYMFLFSGCAAITPSKYAEQVVTHETPNLTKAQVYDIAHQWFKKHYSNDKSKILHKDSYNGVLIGSSVVRIGGLLIVRNVEYKIKIEAKENEFNSSMKVLRYFDTDINGDFPQDEVTQGQINNAHKAMSEAAKSLENYINESTANDANR